MFDRIDTADDVLGLGLRSADHIIETAVQNAAPEVWFPARTQQGGDVVSRAVGAMSEISASSRKITSIIGVIDARGAAVLLQAGRSRKCRSAG